LTSWLQAEVERRADTRQGRALALFDALEELLAGPDFDGGSFLSRPHETADGDGGVHLQDVRGLVVSTETLEDYARQAGASHPEEAGYQLQILLMGAIVSAGRGDDQAARRARALAELLLGDSRR
jgi:hypothetical protein